MRHNLYVYHDTVTSHILTRGINFLPSDFEAKYVPHNIILAESPSGFGRYDVQTNFKILRGKQEVLEYMNFCQKQNIRVSNWIDFESVSTMHLLTPNEIAEVLYLFHAHQTLRSAFFYKLQNNFVFLTLPNGLTKTYYRHIQHFSPRFRRVLQERVSNLVNEGKSLFFGKKETVAMISESVIEQLSHYFSSGLKIDVAQAYLEGTHWHIPLFIIEDELTLLTTNQTKLEQVGVIQYDVKARQWLLEMND